MLSTTIDFCLWTDVTTLQHHADRRVWPINASVGKHDDRLEWYKFADQHNELDARSMSDKYKN